MVIDWKSTVSFLTQIRRMTVSVSVWRGGFLFFHNKPSLIAILFAPGMWNNWNLGGKKEAKPEGQKHNRVHGAVTTDKSCWVSSQIIKTIPGDFLRWDVALFCWTLSCFMFSTKRKCLMPQTTLSDLSKFNLDFYSLPVWAKRSKYFIAVLLLGFNRHIYSAGMQGLFRGKHQVFL